MKKEIRKVSNRSMVHYRNNKMKLQNRLSTDQIYEDVILSFGELLNYYDIKPKISSYVMLENLKFSSKRSKADVYKVNKNTNKTKYENRTLKSRLFNIFNMARWFKIINRNQLDKNRSEAASDLTIEVIKQYNKPTIHDSTDLSDTRLSGESFCLNGFNKNDSTTSVKMLKNISITQSNKPIKKLNKSKNDYKVKINVIKSSDEYKEMIKRSTRSGNKLNDSKLNCAAATTTIDSIKLNNGVRENESIKMNEHSRTHRFVRNNNNELFVSDYATKSASKLSHDIESKTNEIKTIDGKIKNSDACPENELTNTDGKNVLESDKNNCSSKLYADKTFGNMTAKKKIKNNDSCLVNESNRSDRKPERPLICINKISVDNFKPNESQLVSDKIKDSDTNHRLNVLSSCSKPELDFKLNTPTDTEVNSISIDDKPIDTNEELIVSFVEPFLLNQSTINYTMIEKNVIILSYIEDQDEFTEPQHCNRVYETPKSKEIPVFRTLGCQFELSYAVPQLNFLKPKKLPSRNRCACRRRRSMNEPRPYNETDRPEPNHYERLTTVNNTCAFAHDMDFREVWCPNNAVGLGRKEHDVADYCKNNPTNDYSKKVTSDESYLSLDFDGKNDDKKLKPLKTKYASTESILETPVLFCESSAINVNVAKIYCDSRVVQNIESMCDGDPHSEYNSRNAKRNNMSMKEIKSRIDEIENRLKRLIETNELDCACKPHTGHDAIIPTSSSKDECKCCSYDNGNCSVRAKINNYSDGCECTESVRCYLCKILNCLYYVLFDS